MTPNWFVAWPVTAAPEWLPGLVAGAPGGLHFLHPDDLHVTLAFLGRYEPGLLKKITSLLKGLPLRGMEVQPDRLIALPQPRRFSALAFSFGNGRMEVDAQIARWRERICREAGAPVDLRAPLPHLTVARPDRRIGESDRDLALAWMEQLPPQTAQTLRFDPPRIYSWAPKGSASRYERLS